MDHARSIARLCRALEGLIHLPPDVGYRSGVLIWAHSERRPLAVARCASAADVQRCLRIARELELPLSVRGGGHDFAGRALCDGIVLDLSAMRSVTLERDRARVGGGARVSDLFAVTQARGLAPVSGAASMVGVAGLTLGGGYGPLIARFGLACDNLLSADVVLADGQIVRAGPHDDAELFWALRGGGGNFGVVTSLELAVHALPSVRAGMILYPLEQAANVFEQANALCQVAPDELTVQLGIIPGPGGAPCAIVAPTWCGRPEAGSDQTAPLERLGTALAIDVRERSYADSCALFDPFIVNGRRTSMRTRWVARFDDAVARLLIDQVARRPSPLCSVLSHEFRGAAARVAPVATAFGQRAPHVLLEILAQTESGDGSAERAWAQTTADRLEPHALPGSYANMAALEEPERATSSFGPNAARLMAAKRHYDPARVFSSALTLPSS